MTQDEVKRLIAAYTEEVWNQGNLAAIGRFYATDYVNHDVSAPQVYSLADYKQWASACLAGLPDLAVAIDGMIAEGDMCSKRYTVSGLHTGPLVGVPATGKPVRFSGVATYRIAGGKIAECWWVYDLFGLLVQLGVIPVPSAA